MKERPILFSAPMVRAILAGTKSQTRRAVKGVLRAAPPIDTDCIKDRDGLPSKLPGPRDWDLCPYGQPGDWLWVREAHAIFETHGQQRKDGERWGPWGGLPTALSPDGSKIVYFREGFDRCAPGRWRPSIHMPRWASRITLEVTGVRVERLQDISEADAWAEGVESDFASAEYAAKHGSLCGRQFRYGYANLWGQINGPGSWGANPWVWVVEFKRIEAQA